VDREAGASYAFAIVDGDGSVHRASAHHAAVGSGAIVGMIQLSSVSRGVWENATLGYWVAESRNGRGVATEAVAQAVAFAFGRLGLHRVQAGVMPRNLRSLRVLEKNGFRHEGVAERYLRIAGRWEDHAILALTFEEWHRA
jgi:[ribosomal protein S5]-alanine N-acetyltransferase